MHNEYRGTGVALVTPFFDSGEVDYNGFGNLIEYVIQRGVNYLVVLGTTGESATCSEEEKKAILEYAIKVNQGRLPIVFGMGGNNTAALIDSFDRYNLEGVDAILSASPYYNKPTQEGILQHYLAIADKSPKPVILYNVPGRTASNITAETTLKLAHHPNIIGIKEASGNLEQCMYIARNKPDNFLLISGDDLLTTSMISFGAQGVISVLANAFPSEFSLVINSALKGDFATATKGLFDLLEINKLMYTESNPVGVKAALEIKGIIDRTVRLPLVEASDQLRMELSEMMRLMK